MPVSYTRKEVKVSQRKWEMIRDCIDGEDAVKARRTKYLPRPNPDDTSKENDARYSEYLTRAVFYNVTCRTLDGLVGQVFLRPPAVELPDQLEGLKVDVDGVGVGLDQQAKRTLRGVLSYGRMGLFIDYPATDTPTSREDQDRGFIRPTITLYEPWQIINWRTITVGARKLLSLVVLQEEITEPLDDFEDTVVKQWRVLRLVNGQYHVELYKEANGTFGKVSEFVPRGANSQPLDTIPFLMVGAVNNDDTLDKPPIYDLASLNIAHYRNSADYEEACFIVGQPTICLAGLTASWVKEVLQGKVHIGSRAAIPLPAGGSANMLQAAPNTLPFEAMEAKERQMVALGAKLVETSEVQRTLGEAELEEASETSILTTAADNVSRAYTDALRWCGQFSGTEVESILYTLNTDFPAARMTPEDRRQLVSEWQSGALAFSEMRSALRKAGIATLDDEEAKDEIESSPPPILALQEKSIDAKNTDKDEDGDE